MRLAWSNLSHDRLRFLVTIAGIAFAVFLMIFEGSLLIGFARAASRVIDSMGADLWITARGVSCLDFPVSLPRRFREVALGVPGVQSVNYLVSGFGQWQKPSGARQTVIILGAERKAGGVFAGPLLDSRITPDAVLIDRSNATELETVAFPVGVEISRRRAIVSGIVDGFASFIGSPYVFAGLADAARYIGLGPEETVFLLVRTKPGWDHAEIRRQLARRLPETDVWTTSEFSHRAKVYWLTQTGAGSGMVLSALLAFLVGLVIVSQNIYATTMENIEEFATLKAMGASRAYVERVVLVQALLSGLIGCLAAMAAVYPLLSLARMSIAWLFTPPWLVPPVFAAGLMMCVVASLASIRKAISVPPGEVFRA